MRKAFTRLIVAGWFLATGSAVFAQTKDFIGAMRDVEPSAVRPIKIEPSVLAPYAQALLVVNLRVPNMRPPGKEDIAAAFKKEFVLLIAGRTAAAWTDLEVSNLANGVGYVEVTLTGRLMTSPVEIGPSQLSIRTPKGVSPNVLSLFLTDGQSSPPQQPSPPQQSPPQQPPPVSRSPIDQVLSLALDNPVWVVVIFVAGLGFMAFWRSITFTNAQRLEVEDLQRRLREATLRVPSPAKVEDVVVEQGKSAEPSDHEQPPLPIVQPPKVPDSLVASLQKHDAVLVVGAGVSAQAGLTTRNQFWLDMVADLRAELGKELVHSLTQVIEQRGADLVVETVLARAGREAVVAAIGSRVGNTAVTPSALHRDLADLPWNVVIDFTWDALAIAAFSGRSPRVFSSPLAGADLPTALREAEKSLPIVKAYGTFQDPAGLILTPQQYRSALQRSPEFVRAIGSLFTTKDFLFVGVALDTIDRFLEALPPDFEARHRNHLALLPATAEAEVWRQGVGARFGIELLTYDPHDGHLEVREFVSRLLLRYDERQDLSSTTAMARLSRVRISNIGHFAGDSLASDAATLATPDKPASGPTAGLDLTLSEDNWTLILGNNGSGKSTLLRSMALALCAEDERARGAAQRLLRFGERQGEIEITIGGNVYRMTLIRESDRVMVRAPADTPLTSKVTIVLGFPAVRGAMSRAPSGPREVKRQDPTVDDVVPLINNAVDVRLDDLRQWILNTMVATERGDPAAAATLQMIRHIIGDLVPGEHVELTRFDPNTFAIFLNVGGQEVPFDSISQGMASVFNWVGWLMQRLDDVYRDNPRNAEDRANGVDPRRALVLVDEVDAHLHPNWQRASVGIVRRRFPNVQVIATSHSALLAGALPSSSIRVVERDPETGVGQVTAPDREVKGRTADDVYSALFGLDITRDPETEVRILRYFDLYEKTRREPQEDDELAKLEKWFESLDYGGDVIVTAVRKLVQEKRPSLSATGRDLEQVEAGFARLRE